MAAESGLSNRSRLKVLFILDAFPDPYAGTEGQFWLLFNQLDRALVNPAVLLLRPSPYLQSRIRNAAVKVLGVQRLRSVRSLRKILAAVRWARRERFDIAHIFFNDSTLVFPVPLKLAGIRVIVARRDLGFWYTRWNLPVLRLNAWFVDAVVANCRAVKEAVSRRERYPQSKISVIYNGLRLARSDVPTEAISASITLHSFSEEALRIVIVANLRPLKRIGDAIRALARLEGRAALAHLEIIGEDRGNASEASHRAELECLADELGVAERVHFRGKIADPMPFVREASVCMLCSETEGLSNSIIEYMTAGKPVVCSDAGGNAELVRDGVSGFVRDVGDVQGMADALRRLLEDEGLRERMGAQARERAVALFSPHRMTQAHLQLYASLGRKAT